MSADQQQEDASNKEASGTATTPLLPRSDESDAQKVELTVVQVDAPGRETPSDAHSPNNLLAAANPNDSATATAAVAATASLVGKQVVGSPTLSNEYRFVHQRIPPRQGKLRFLLPVLLLGFEVLFIVLLAIFGNYAAEDDNAHVTRTYPLFADLHAITLLGFGFLMTFLKRYGYGSIGFNLLLVAVVVQWALIVRGFLTASSSSSSDSLSFSLGLDQLVHADFVAIAVLISFGAVLGKTTLTQLVVMALIEVVIQSLNEFVNVHIFESYDVGRSVYVHLFGALFGLAVSKVLHCKCVHSPKQASVYHSDLFAFIGTLFLWVYYPSFNGLLANTSVDQGQGRAIINTYAAIAASCVVTFATSSLAGKGKITAMHIQHATIAGGIAIGSVADLKVEIYIALIVGSIAGLLSTVGYQYVEPLVTRSLLKLHDTCGVLNLHVIPGLIAAILGAIFAACASYKDYGESLYEYYPARTPINLAMDEANEVAMSTTTFAAVLANGTASSSEQEAIVAVERSAGEQAGFQLAALAVTIALAVVGGALTGALLRLPLFEQLSEDVEMFDDEAQWVTPDDYALKLTFATNQPSEKKEEAKV